MQREEIEKIRREYALTGLRKDDVDSDPINQFRKWFEEAVRADLLDASAMTLATSTPEGRPSARVVLLKSFDEEGFVFYGNYESRKGLEMLANPTAALLFYWREIERQVRVVGTVHRVDQETSARYFRTRPFESQIAALVSPQSEVIPHRELLEEHFQELEKRYKDKEVPLPPAWGGYTLAPEEFEFWQGGRFRLHDRIRYTRIEKAWAIDRLAP